MYARLYDQKYVDTPMYFCSAVSALVKATKFQWRKIFNASAYNDILVCLYQFVFMHLLLQHYGNIKNAFPSLICNNLTALHTEPLPKPHPTPSRRTGTLTLQPNIIDKSLMWPMVK